MKEHIINNIASNSIAQELGIEAGDCLISIDGRPVYDCFDYLYYTSSQELTLEIKKKDGTVFLYEIEKSDDENLGIEFINSLMDNQKTCRNNCIFCFIDQMPKG